MKKKSSANDLWDMIWRRQIFTACRQFDESNCLSQIFHLPMHGRRWITIWRAYYSVRFPNLEHLCNSTANSQTVCFTFCLEFLSLSISISDRFCYGLGRVFSFSAEDYIKKEANHCYRMRILHIVLYNTENKLAFIEYECVFLAIGRAFSLTKSILLQFVSLFTLIHCGHVLFSLLHTLTLAF